MGEKGSFGRIYLATTPAGCKKLGREVYPFDQELWDQHLEEVAFEVARQKFGSDASLRKVLLSTGEHGLAEAAPNDSIWGVGLKLGGPRIQGETWQGRSVLGCVCHWLRYCAQTLGGAGWLGIRAGVSRWSCAVCGCGLRAVR